MVVVVVVVGRGGGSKQLLCLNPTTVMVVLLFGLWLLLGCDNIFNVPVEILINYGAFSNKLITVICNDRAFQQ